MNHLYQHFRVAFPIDYCLKHFLIAFYYCPLNFKDSKNVWLER